MIRTQWRGIMFLIALIVILAQWSGWSPSSPSRCYMVECRRSNVLNLGVTCGNAIFDRK